jgi:hypothetical protein
VDAVDGSAGLKAAVSTGLVVPLTLIRGVVVVTEYGAQVRCPPVHTGLCLGALLSIGGHGRAEALTIPSSVTGAGVVHTSLIEDRGVHLAVARAEYAALDDAALLLRPGAAVWVQAAGFRGAAHVWAGGSFLPAIAKVQLTAHHHVIPCGEVIAGAVIEVPTQATNGALVGGSQLNEDGGLFVPDDNNASAGLHH